MKIFTIHLLHKGKLLHTIRIPMDEIGKTDMILITSCCKQEGKDIQKLYRVVE